MGGKGTWSANFYGAEEDTMHPMAAIGEFNAAIGGEIGILPVSPARSLQPSSSRITWDRDLPVRS